MGEQAFLAHGRVLDVTSCFHFARFCCIQLMCLLFGKHPGAKQCYRAASEIIVGPR